MHSRKDEFNCKLFIDTLDDYPEIISDLTGVKASEIIIKGTPWLSPMTKKIVEGKLNDSNLWIYETGKMFNEKGVYLNSVLSEILQIFEGKKTVFKEIFHKYVQNHIVCNGYFYDNNPFFKLDKEIIEKLAYYKVDVEFDVYFLGDSD